MSTRHRGSPGGPAKTLSFKIHSVPFDHANLQNKERASIPTCPQSVKNTAGPFEAGVSELTGKCSKDISMVDPMGKKSKVIIFTSQEFLRSVHREQVFPPLISHEARRPIRVRGKRSHGQRRWQKEKGRNGDLEKKTGLNSPHTVITPSSPDWMTSDEDDAAEQTKVARKELQTQKNVERRNRPYITGGGFAPARWAPGASGSRGAAREM